MTVAIAHIARVANARRGLRGGAADGTIRTSHTLPEKRIPDLMTAALKIDHFAAPGLVGRGVGIGHQAIVDRLFPAATAGFGGHATF